MSQYLSMDTKLSDKKLLDYYWNPSNVPKDKRLKLMSAGEQAKQHLAGKAKHRGIKYTKGD